jgi:hypothetical protein
MPYPCPRCGKSLQVRWLKVTDVTGGPSLSLFYPLLVPFFRRFYCPEHGLISMSALPPEQQRKLRWQSRIWFVFVLGIMSGLGWLLYRWFH